MRSIKLGQSILYISAIVWIILTIVLFSTFKKKQSIPLLNYIPKNAELILQINVPKLSERFIEDFFSNEQDKELSELLEKKITTLRLEKKGTDGIDFLSKIYYFQIPFEQKKLNCILTTINNSNKFQNFMQSEKTVFAKTEKIGLYLLNSHEFNSLDQQKITSHFSKILLNPVQNQFGEIDLKSDLSFFQINKNTDIFNRLALNSILLEKEMTFKGTFLNDQKNTPLKLMLKPNYFHISSSILPQQYNDSIQKWLSALEVSIPKIRGFSLNYQGLHFFQSSNPLLFIPKMELLVQFEKEIEWQQIFKNQDELKKKDITFQNNKIIISGIEYFIHQIDLKTIYIGKNQKPELVINSKQKQLVLKGKPHHLTQFEGQSLIRAFLEISPKTRAFNTFFKHSKSLELELDSRGQFVGKFESNTDYLLSQEMLRLLLIGQFL